MNWDRIEGQWKQQRGKAVYDWGKLMNDELAAISGKQEQLVGMLQEKYGIAKEDAKRQVDEFKTSIEHLKKTNANLLIAKKILSKKKNRSSGISVKTKKSPSKRQPS